MSQTHLVTIDFLGIGSDENTRSAMDCQRQLMKRRAIQSCLRKIKPHMLQQVLSHCEVSQDLKTMELFPQQATGLRSDRKDSQQPFVDTQINLSEGAAAALNFKPPTKPLSPPLTICYNDAVNVYGNVSSDKAKSITTMAAGNGNTPNLSNSIALSSGSRESFSNPEESVNGANHRHLHEIAHWKLPLVKKKTLRCFLQKRKAR